MLINNISFDSSCNGGLLVGGTCAMEAELNIHMSQVNYQPKINDLLVQVVA